MPTLEFEVLGPPRPKERARVMKSGHAYTPEKTKQYETAVANAAFVALHKGLKENGPWFMETTYEVEIECHFAPLVGRAKRPDLDNVTKAILDGLQGCLYRNDVSVRKIVAMAYVDCKVAKTKIRITAL